MPYELEEIANQLKVARLAKGLSQRALSAKTGLTQAHISKIENASVDLQLSNLIELARALDLEVTLVPARAVPAVQGILHSFEPMRQMQDAKKPPQTKAIMHGLHPRPAYSLDEDDD